VSAPFVVVVAGTGTEVGKTWVAARVAAHARAAGLRVLARKPAQSFEPASGPTDADLLAAATGQQPADVCPPHRWYERALAPPMAADALRRPPFTVADVAGEVGAGWTGADLVLVESAGGVRSPLAVDGDTVDLVAALRPDRVLLVADAGLGTINAVRLSVDALAGPPVTILLNRFDASLDVHRRNRSWLAERCGGDVEVDVAALGAGVAQAARDKVVRCADS
jgi:dethiobiotin synthetase